MAVQKSNYDPDLVTPILETMSNMSKTEAGKPYLEISNEEATGNAKKKATPGQQIKSLNSGSETDTAINAVHTMSPPYTEP